MFVIYTVFRDFVVDCKTVSPLSIFVCVQARCFSRIYAIALFIFVSIIKITPEQALLGRFLFYCLSHNSKNTALLSFTVKI